MIDTSAQLAARARSWLFAPGDSERKMEKALASEADIILIDLEDAVAESEKSVARQLVANFIATNAGHRARLWVRINPVDGPHALADLSVVMPSLPGGIMQPKVRGRADVELLGHYLSAFEATASGEIGSTKVIIIATETPEAMFATQNYAGLDRLAAMTWGAEDIATAIGATTNRDEQGEYLFPYQLARTMCVLGAAVAGVPAIETVHMNFRDEPGLRKVAADVRKGAFCGMIAIHPAQVVPINQVFSPTQEELGKAQEIVDLFAANPHLGTIGHRGMMLDLPHLNRARALLSPTRR